MLDALSERLLRAAAVVLVMGLLGAVVTGVVSRLFNRPVIWSEELAQYLLVWTGFLGLMIAARRRSHIRIDVFINLLPRPLRLVWEVLIQAAMIVFALAMARYGIALIGRNWDVDWVTLPLSAALLYVPIPFAAATLVVQALIEIALAFKGRIAAEPEPGTQPL
jgi:TRAP-type transport system small permease protein